MNIEEEDGDDYDNATNLYTKSCIENFHHSLSIASGSKKNLQDFFSDSKRYARIIENICRFLGIDSKDLNTCVTLPPLYKPDRDNFVQSFDLRKGPPILNVQNNTFGRPTLSEVFDVNAYQKGSKSAYGVTCKIVEFVEVPGNCIGREISFSSFYVDKTNQGILPIEGKIFSEVLEADKLAKVELAKSELLQCLRERFSEEIKKKLYLKEYPLDRKIHFSRFPLSGDYVVIKNFQVKRIFEFIPKLDSTELLVYPILKK
eukprot:GHVP01015710.1.p1 GENE.GHVP01015710.1~~GHVP01015710.1.p1  ORF type:complete len:302 (-),score=53.58 GHVP01015710.1:90-866(-)